MKKYLKLSAMCLLASAMAVFSSSCKDEDHGVADPVLGMEIDLGEEADEELSIAATVDQVAKVINVTCNKSADLSNASCKFKLADGAFLYSPFKANPVTLDLNEESGVVVQTGDKFVFYKIVTEVDYALRGMTAHAGAVEGAVTIDQGRRVIDIYFNDANADLSNVSVELDLSPNATPVDPSSASATMDLTADTTLLKVNMLGSEMAYKVATWSDLKGDENLRINASGVGLSKDDEGNYKMTVEGGTPMFWTQKFQKGYAGHIFSFEYKATADVVAPKLLFNDKDKNQQVIGYDLKAKDEWTSYAIDLGPMLKAAAGEEVPGYSVTVNLGDVAAGTEIELRNIQVRERTADEQAVYDKAFVFNFSEGVNQVTFMNITEYPEYPAFQFTTTDTSDPFMRSDAHGETLTPDDHGQLYLEYKSTLEFQVEFYLKELGTYNVPWGVKLPATDIWKAIHIDYADALREKLKEHPDALDGGSRIRFDFYGLSGNAVIQVRNMRLQKK